MNYDIDEAQRSGSELADASLVALKPPKQAFQANPFSLTLDGVNCG